MPDVLFPFKPERPEIPDVPERPEMPERPERPDKPETPDKPEMPDKPDIPEAATKFHDEFSPDGSTFKLAAIAMYELPFW